MEAKPKDYGTLAPGRILVRRISKPDTMKNAAGIIVPVGVGKTEQVSASEFGLVLACSVLYMLHQGQFERGEISGWPIEPLSIIEFSKSNQWDCNTNVDRCEVYINSNTWLRTLKSDEEFPVWVRDYLRHSELFAAQTDAPTFNAKGKLNK